MAVSLPASSCCPLVCAQFPCWLSVNLRTLCLYNTFLFLKRTVLVSLLAYPFLGEGRRPYGSTKTIRSSTWEFSKRKWGHCHKIYIPYNGENELLKEGRSRLQPGQVSSALGHHSQVGVYYLFSHWFQLSNGRKQYPPPKIYMDLEDKIY